MRAFENIAIAIAVVLVAMACMVFGDWLARSKAKPNYYYCQNSSAPDYNKLTSPQESTTPNKKEARETANERYHELCSQWRAAQAAENATHVAWLQLWFGVAGLIGLGMTVYFTAHSARAASDAAVQMARQVDVQIRAESPVLSIQRINITDDSYATIDMKNVGKSTAIILEWSTSCDTRGNWPSRPAYGTPTPIHDVVLEEGETYSILALARGMSSLGGLVSGVRGAEVLVWGYIRYEDVFGGHREVGFARWTTHSVLSGPPQPEGRHLYWLRYGGDAYNYDREVQPKLVAFAP